MYLHWCSLTTLFNGVMPHGENVIRQSSSVYQDATNVIYLHDPQDIEQMKRIHNSIGGIDDNAAAKMLERNLKEMELVSTLLYW